MADYYPLIARAVAGLDKNTGENRRALYERARAALVNQLRGVDPPLDEADITRERLGLEEAIRRLEAEAAKTIREESTVAEAASPSLRDQALRDFRHTVAEAEGLGEASHEANRTARETYQGFEDHAAADEAGAAPADLQAHVDAIPDERPVEPASHYFEPPEDDQAVAADVEETDRERAEEHAAPLSERAQSEPAYGRARTGLPPPPASHDEDDAEYGRPARSYGRIVKVAVVLLLIAAVAAAGYWQRGALVDGYKLVMASLSRSSTTTPTTTAPKTAEAPTGRPKITDRIGATNDSTATPATAPAAAVAQKVVLYDEDSSDPQGKRYVGSAVWRTETVSPGAGLAPELAIRADVEIPERRMRMTWSLRRNTDKALPASHTIEIMFTLPSDFPEGGIANVPGILMKQNEQARGLPLAGLSVKVTNNYFLIGLSAVTVDQQRNVELLKDRDWFDIPIVYTSGKRAILAVEKGTPGARAFAESFKAWGE
ncbi:hypothetical protein ASD45_15090 [Pseudolabrys sp. Root1462]|uniref:hypothetical protein n=1 Tax=Pseudolabrys sp. Root1462 TaxID=1736466 RepID=UPI000703639B|nr:hypothetical protein [Pseudolabrys sp. Root1462]KQZ02034.1 hypothetical protein ASD45_15090 [Pseudolabrys sp. Root1462]